MAIFPLFFILLWLGSTTQAQSEPPTSLATEVTGQPPTSLATEPTGPPPTSLPTAVTSEPSEPQTTLPTNAPVPTSFEGLPDTVEPKPQGDVGALYRLYGFHNCNNDEKKAIYDAFGEKDTITGISSSFFINWNGAVAIDFIG